MTEATKDDFQIEDGEVVTINLKFLFEATSNQIPNIAELRQNVILTYPSFISLNEIIKMIIERYKEVNGHVEQARILLFLNDLLDRCWPSANNNRSEIKKAVLELLDSINSEIVEETVSQIRRKIKSKFTEKDISTCIVISPSITLNKNALDNFSPIDIARQLTLMDYQIFSRIQPDELLNNAWMKNPKENAPNVHLFIKSFNSTGLWVQSEILCESNQKRQLKLVIKFIEVSQELLVFNNYNGFCGICSALNSSVISKLKKLWSLVPAKYKNAFDKTRKLAEPYGNYKKMRKKLATSERYMPYIGMFLQDLVYIDEREKNRELKKEHINYNKCHLIANVLNQILQYQETRYNFSPDPEIQEYIVYAPRYGSDFQFELVDYLEPKGALPPVKPRQLMGNEEKRQQEMKILLLGKGNTGKTTISKQVSLCFEPSFPLPQRELLKYAQIIQDNTLNTAKHLLEIIKQHPELKSELEEEKIQSERSDMPNTGPISENLILRSTSFQTRTKKEKLKRSEPERSTQFSKLFEGERSPQIIDIDSKRQEILNNYVQECETIKKKYINTIEQFMDDVQKEFMAEIISLTNETQSNIKTLMGIKTIDPIQRPKNFLLPHIPKLDFLNRLPSPQKRKESLTKSNKHKLTSSKEEKSTETSGKTSVVEEQEDLIEPPSPREIIQEETTIIDEKMVEILYNATEMDNNFSEKFSSLWKTVQRTKFSQLFDELPTQAKYFFDNIKRISEKEYLPTSEDIYKNYTPTTGHSSTISGVVHGYQIRLLDVGGRPSEVRKWSLYYQNESIHLIIFVVSLDELLTTGLIDTLKLWEETSEAPKLDGVPFALFLNKYDLYCKNYYKKVKDLTIPKGLSYSPQACVKYFIGQFRKAFKGCHMVEYVTCAVETKSLSVILESLVNIF